MEKGDAVPGALAGGGAQDAVGGAGADAVGEGFQALADGHDEGPGDGRAIDPVAGEVLGLEAAVRGGLEEVRGQHGVFVRADALSVSVRKGWVRVAVLDREGAGVRILDDFEFMLLIGVEEAVEGCWGQVESFRDQ